MKVKSDIEFGKKYRDKNTGFVGTATGVYFYQYGCTRVTLDTLVSGEVKQCTFDEQSLETVEPAKPFKAKARSGGPHMTPGRPSGIR